MEEEIVKLHLEGYTQKKIMEMLGVSKPKVFRALDEQGLIKKQGFNDELYSTFEFDGEKWVTYYVCDTCDKDIKMYASEKYTLARNIKRKKTCKKCSLDKQVGEGNPFYGKKHADDTKDRISESRKGQCTGENNCMANPETRRLLGEVLKKTWASPEMDHVKLRFSKRMTKFITDGNLKSFNKSKAEYEIVEIITDLGIHCEHGFKVETKEFDIYIPKYNLLIEYNGDYYHCNPKKFNKDYYNKKKSQTASEIWEYDKNKFDLAIDKGYNMEVIWEADYKKSKDCIKTLINNYEQKFTKQP
jgi:hypothetical protein